MPLPNITPQDLRLALLDIFQPDADLEDLRDLRRILANLSADETAAALRVVVAEHAAKIRAELD